MNRVEFIVKLFGTGVMFTFGKRDSDITVNDNSAFDAKLYYRGQEFDCSHWHTLEINEEE